MKGIIVNCGFLCTLWGGSKVTETIYIRKEMENIT